MKRVLLLYIQGGTFKVDIFKAADLPVNVREQEEVLLRMIGSSASIAGIRMETGHNIEYGKAGC